MVTGIMSAAVAAHVFATLKVASQVSRGELVRAALHRGSEYGYYFRQFERDAADGVPSAIAVWADVAGAARPGKALVSLSYDPSSGMMKLGFGNGETVAVTSTFDNSSRLAVRVATADDPAGVSGSSEVLLFDRDAVEAGVSGVTVSAEMLPPVAAGMSEG